MISISFDHKHTADETWLEVRLIHCPKCQTENPDGKKFCRECGSKLRLACPQCSAEILSIEQDYGLASKMRVGLHSGKVVVASIGDDQRMDYTAMSGTSNLAARMESLA